MNTRKCSCSYLLVLIVISHISLYSLLNVFFIFIDLYSCSKYLSWLGQHCKKQKGFFIYHLCVCSRVQLHPPEWVASQGVEQIKSLLRSISPILDSIISSARPGWQPIMKSLILMSVRLTDEMVVSSLLLYARWLKHQRQSITAMKLQIKIRIQNVIKHKTVMICGNI